MMEFIVESAVRGLIIALLVGTGLWVMRVRNVFALKMAWTLSLAAALMMPMAMRVDFLPTVQLDALKKLVGFKSPELRAQPHAVAPQVVVVEQKATTPAAEAPAPAQSAGTLATNTSIPAPQAPRFQIQPMLLITAIYCTVLAVLMLRILVGALTAFRLWFSAEKVDELAGITAANLRVSARVHSPVTVGRGILLPLEYEEWSEEKLGIVLAHEESHVRHLDFYLQLAAGVYAAIFWFSPLGWWLKRKLTDLSETISDGAALGVAGDVASYAQLLLEFAALPRPTYTGVAMARTSNLKARIEGLLNETHIVNAFSGGRVRMTLAGLLVPAALCMATLHVQAASDKAERKTVTVQVNETKSGETTTQTNTLVATDTQQKEIQLTVKADGGSADNKEKRQFLIVQDGEAMALIADPKEKLGVSVSGSEMSNELLKKAISQAKGKFFWFTRDGKSYIIDDQKALKEIEEAMTPFGEDFEINEPDIEIPENFEIEMKDFNAPSKEELKKDLKELQESLKKLDSKLGKGDSQKELEELQGKLGDLEGKLGLMQAKLDQNIQVKVQKEMKAEMAEAQKLRVEAMAQAKQEIKLRTQVRVLDQEKIHAIVDECLKNGTARLVD